VYSEATPELDRPTLAVIGIGTMPPHPETTAVDPKPFAHQAGLQPGHGVTIVLRVEVLGVGQVGQVEVDVSGGAPEVDRAAIAFVRALPWIGGMVNGHPATFWIRWGVRLQG